MKKLALFFTILALLTCTVSAELPLDAPAEIAETRTAADVFLSVFEHDGSDFVYPDEYAGHWTDGDRFHIALTDVSEETLTKYLGWMQDFAPKTIFHEAKYSYAELKEAAPVYIDELGNYVGTVCGWRIMPKLNCIVLEFVGEREPIVEALAEIGAPEGMFSVGQGTTECPMPEIVPPAVVPGGDQIDALEAYQLLEQSFDIAYGGYPDHYAGCWLDGGALHVGVTADDEETLSVYEDILAPAACEIVYDVQPYGYNQLMALHDAISEKLNTDGNPYELSSWGVDTSGCRIVVESRIGYTDGLYNALAGLAADLGMGEDAFYLEECAVEIVVQTDEYIIEEPAAEEVVEEEVVVEEILAMSVPVSENPLLPYFDKTYGSVPDWYAGLYRTWEDADDPSDHNAYIEIGLTADAPEAVRDELTSLFPFTNVIFTEHKYSYNTLQAYKTEALARAREQGTLIGGGIDEYANKAELTVVPSLGENIPAALTDMLNGLAAEMGVGEDVYILTVSLEADEPAVEVVTVAPAEPVTSPATGDPTTILCLLLSALASVCICFTKKK